MSTQHTPGPWTWFNYPDGRKLLSAPSRAVIHAPDGPLGIETADASLIAAAPSMLDALQVTAGNIRSLGPAGALPEPYTVWLRVVEDAIATAEGRS